jgi:hypothetical protein
MDKKMHTPSAWQLGTSINLFEILQPSQTVATLVVLTSTIMSSMFGEEGLAACSRSRIRCVLPVPSPAISVLGEYVAISGFRKHRSRRH